MDKIIFKIGKNLLTIDKYTKDIKVDLNNTNVIDNFISLSPISFWEEYYS